MTCEMFSRLTIGNFHTKYREIPLVLQRNIDRHDHIGQLSSNPTIYVLCRNYRTFTANIFLIIGCYINFVRGFVYIEHSYETRS